MEDRVHARRRIHGCARLARRARVRALRGGCAADADPRKRTQRGTALRGRGQRVVDRLDLRDETRRAVVAQPLHAADAEARVRRFAHRRHVRDERGQQRQRGGDRRYPSHPGSRRGAPAGGGYACAIDARRGGGRHCGHFTSNFPRQGALLRASKGMHTESFLTGRLASSTVARGRVWNPCRVTLAFDRRSQPSLANRRFTINSLEAASGKPDIRSATARPQLRVGRRRASRRHSALVLLRACRPRQWTKNLLVLAAPAAAGVIDRGAVLAELAGAFVALCAISSATYLVNDVRDRDADRLHPQKRHRPVAAGELSVRAALLSALALAVFGLALATAIDWKLGALGVGYLGLTASYSLWWRNVVVFDILVIAAGFVLRALAGGVATDVYLSRYFIVVTACCAIFLVAAKRYAEQRDRAVGSRARAALARYTAAQLRATLGLSATVAGVTYGIWAFTRP